MSLILVACNTVSYWYPQHDNCLRVGWLDTGDDWVMASNQRQVGEGQESTTYHQAWRGVPYPSVL